MLIQIPFIRGIRIISKVLQNRSWHLVDDESKFDIELIPTSLFKPTSNRINSVRLVSLNKFSGSGMTLNHMMNNANGKLDATRSNLG